jgi:hypothetical protein
MNLRRAATVIGLSLAVVGSAAGCGRPASTATVNGRVIARADFQREMEVVRAVPDPEGAGHLQAAWLTAVIYDRLVTDELRRRHLVPGEADTAAAVKTLSGQFGADGVAPPLPAWFRDRVLARDARAASLRAALAGTISGESLRRFYDTHQPTFEAACFSQIVLKTKDEAAAVSTQLKAAPDLARAFADAARLKSSDADSAARGGDLGCPLKSELSEDVAEAAYTSPLRTPSDIVHIGDTYNLFLVRSKTTPPFDQIKDRVQREADAWADNVLHEWVVRAANAARVTVDPRIGRYEAGDDGNQKQVLAAPAGR